MYRSHRIHQCPRCKDVFETQQALEDHVVAIDPCELRSGKPFDCVTAKLKELLQNTKGEYRRQSEADRWRGVYHLLFPDDEIPSPCRLSLDLYLLY